MTRGDGGGRKLRIFSQTLLIGAAAVLLGLAGLASAAVATGADPTRRVHRTPRTTKTLLASYSGKRGKQLVVEMNGQKLSLFGFAKDPPGKSTCYGKCSRTWHPLIDRGKIVVAHGSHINTRQLRTLRRTGGSVQIEYYGQPLYRCRKDTRTGQIYGVDSYQFGGSWGLMGVQGGPLPTPDYPSHVAGC